MQQPARRAPCGPPARLRRSRSPAGRPLAPAQTAGSGQGAAAFCAGFFACVCVCVCLLTERGSQGLTTWGHWSVRLPQGARTGEEEHGKERPGSAEDERVECERGGRLSFTRLFSVPSALSLLLSALSLAHLGTLCPRTHTHTHTLSPHRSLGRALPVWRERERKRPRQVKKWRMPARQPRRPPPGRAWRPAARARHGRRPGQASSRHPRTALPNQPAQPSPHPRPRPEGLANLRRRRRPPWPPPSRRPSRPWKPGPPPRASPSPKSGSPSLEV